MEQKKTGDEISGFKDIAYAGITVSRIPIQLKEMFKTDNATEQNRLGKEGIAALVDSRKVSSLGKINILKKIHTYASDDLQITVKILAGEAIVHHGKVKDAFWIIDKKLTDDLVSKASAKAMNQLAKNNDRSGLLHLLDQIPREFSEDCKNVLDKINEVDSENIEVLEKKAIGLDTKAYLILIGIATDGKYLHPIRGNYDIYSEENRERARQAVERVNENCTNLNTSTAHFLSRVVKKAPTSVEIRLTLKK